MKLTFKIKARMIPIHKASNKQIWIGNHLHKCGLFSEIKKNGKENILHEIIGVQEADAQIFAAYAKSNGYIDTPVTGSAITVTDNDKVFILAMNIVSSPIKFEGKKISYYEIEKEEIIEKIKKVIKKEFPDKEVIDVTQDTSFDMSAFLDRCKKKEKEKETDDIEYNED